ncbi:MAG: glycosyltransferase family 39 protein [Chloroflexi bacterium]|nr:glycosyltransferase family 39 protein [Chloroflexota bacterium]
MNKPYTQHSALSTQHYTLWLMVILLLVAAALRLIGLNNVSPPGLEHDEVAHWLINRDILAGNHAIYFTDAYGHEAGYHYFQTIFQVLLGDNAFALRLPSVILGLLGIAVSFALVRRLFGKRVALLAAAYLACLFFPIFYSRLALRAIALPVVSGLSAYFWWRGWGREGTQGNSGELGGTPLSSLQSLSLSVSSLIHHSPFSFALSGLFAGLTLHTYLAARSVPIFYALFIGYLALFHRAEFKQRWKGVVVFGVMMGIAAAPLLLYLLNNPGAEVRVGEVDAPLRALLAGDFRPVLNNGWAILRGFIGPGDPLWRQNVAFRAVFEPISALLFYAGVGLSLWRWRDSRYAFLLLWASTAIIPSLVTVDAPSFIRMINILPVLGVFPAIVMHSLQKLSTEKAELSTDFVHIAYRMSLLLLFVANVGWTVRDTFITWPGNRDEVQFVWQKALTDGAHYLDNEPSLAHAAVGGWTPDSMDAPTMELTLQRDDINLRYFNPEQTLVIPSGMPAEILRPTSLPLHPALEAQLLDWGITPVAAATFTHYPLSQLPIPNPALPHDTVFGDEFRFLGLSPQPSALSTQPSALISYWQVIHPPTSARRMFVHVLDEGGEIVAQDDGLAAAALQPGDLILLAHSLPLPATYTLRLGVYNPETGQQLTTGAGDSFVILAQK